MKKYDEKDDGMIAFDTGINGVPDGDWFQTLLNVAVIVGVLIFIAIVI